MITNANRACLSISLISQNGYPSSRRSLVDDARFESAVVKQTKQAVLEEARNKSNGEFFNDKESLCVVTSELVLVGKNVDRGN